jgi:transposase-like protein
LRRKEKEPKQNYTLEFRVEAVKLVLEPGLSLAEAARRLALPKGSLATWVGQAKGGKRSAAPGSRSVAELEAEVWRLRKEWAETQRERESVKKAAATFAKESLPGTGSSCLQQAGKRWQLDTPVQVMARFLGVSRSGFYAWLVRPLCERAQEEERLKVAIQAAPIKTRQIYGARRLQSELKPKGLKSAGIGSRVYVGK